MDTERDHSLLGFCRCGYPVQSKRLRFGFLEEFWVVYIDYKRGKKISGLLEREGSGTSSAESAGFVCDIVVKDDALQSPVAAGRLANQ